MKTTISKNSITNYFNLVSENQNNSYDINYSNFKLLSNVVDYACYNIVETYYVDLLRNREYNGNNIKTLLDKMDISFDINCVNDIKDFERLNDKLKNILNKDFSLYNILLSDKELGYIRDSINYMKLKLNHLLCNNITVDKYNNANVYNKMNKKYNDLNNLQNLLA